MGPASTKAPARKRNRKRKRRAASSSSSSSDSSSSDEDVPTPSLKPLGAQTTEKESSPSSSSSSESDSDSSSDSFVQQSFQPLAAQQTGVPNQTKTLSRQRSPSPPPPTVTIPSFIPSSGSVENDAQKEQILKDKFRKFWMASVADGFKDDLEEIRKEPNLGTSRLSLLINSLASGADVFTSASRPGDPQAINEMEVVLEGQ